MVSNRNALPTGTAVGGYELIDLVGQGGMGAVYKATAPDGTIVAVKLLASELNENEVQLRRFYQEAEIAMRLDHPNMVRALKVGEDQGRHYFAMEYVDGVSLGQRLKKGKLKEREAVRIIIDVARALHKAHKEGLIHRDVKPDNILLTNDLQAKLADMGLVKQLDADLNLTRTGRGLGTPHFMAPEQFKDAKNADVRCDIYSLGATLYMMVTGELPFRGSGPLDTFMKKSNNSYTPPKELNPNLSTRTAEAIRMAMDANADKRPVSAKEFAEILVGLTKPRSSDATPVVKPAEEDVWYVIYQDKEGTKQKVKGSIGAIEQQVRKGRLDGKAFASRNKKGPFELISTIREFQPMFPKPADAAASTDTEDDHMNATNDQEYEESSAYQRLDGMAQQMPSWVWAVIGAFVTMTLAVCAWIVFG